MENKQLEKEQLVGRIMLELKFQDYSPTYHKFLALERYMRAYLRGQTITELEYELDSLDNFKKPTARTIAALDLASERYDKFMAARTKVAV